MNSRNSKDANLIADIKYDRIMKKTIFLSVCMFLLLSAAGTGQETGNQLNDTISIGEVIITGTKTFVNRNMVPLTVSVIRKENIEYSSESALLPVLSEQVPGFFLTQRGITGFGVSAGSAGQISLRGVGGNPNTQVLILLNGNPQFMGIMGHPLADAYIASDVEKVEVIRGPASTLYGTNAMGGVINIITREQTEDGLTANARLMYGSYNTQKYMVNGGYRKKGFNVFASLNHDRTKGHRDSSDFRITNGYFRTGYEINSHFTVTADFSLANFIASDPGMENADAGYMIDITRGMGALCFNNEFEKTSGSFRFFYNFGEHDITDGFHSTDNNYGALLYQTFKPFRGNSVTAGIDLKKYGGLAENLKAMNGNGMVFGDTTVSEIAAYLYMQQVLGSKITLNAGFRLEHNSSFGNEPVPTGGISWHPTATTSVRASVSKGFRSPTIRELYLWGTSNDELEPEKMINYEIGATHKLFGNKLSLELTVFRASGSNLIKTVAGESGFKYQNTGTFTNTGVEFAGTYRFSDRFSLNANYSYTHMKEPVVASPGQQVFISGTYKWKRLSVNLSTEHIHHLYTRVSPEKDISSYTLLNSKIAFRFNKYIDIFIKGENLTNRNYYINYGYPMPGIVAFGGVNLHI